MKTRAALWILSLWSVAPLHAAAQTPGDRTPGEATPDEVPATELPPDPAPSAPPSEEIPPAREAPVAPPRGEGTPPQRPGSLPPEGYAGEPPPPARGRTTPPAPPVYQGAPPQIIYEPPPPPARPRRSPRTAFWAGARVGAFVPFGTLWYDGVVSGQFVNYRRQAWSDYASPGPMVEVDAGARLGRLYTVFALWERASLGTGDVLQDEFGGQERGDTNFYGVGFRFSTDPDDIGFLIELTLGYRDFTASWEDGTELELRDGWFDGRIGLGADIRLSSHFSLSPLLTLGSGSFDEAEWDNANAGDPRDSLDLTGRYNTVTLQVGGHVDVY